MAKYKIIPSSRTIVQSPISIGHKAEKGVEAIEFDLTAWVETYGSGTLTVIMRRWGDAIPYPIALEIDENNKATWTLSDIDTAKVGMAYAQLSYIVGDEVVKKSDIYTFRVMDSLTGEGEPPEAYESWLEHLTHLAAEAMAEVLDIEGIVTDKTLTVDGGIADGKATGDALALKADKTTTYTKTEVDTLIESVDVETDTTLSVTGKPADAKKTGDEINALKADLGDVENGLNTLDDTLDIKTIEYAGGYIRTADATVDISTIYPSDEIEHSVVPMVEKQNVVVNGTGSNVWRAWYFADANYNRLSYSVANLECDNLVLSAPANTAFLILNRRKERNKKSYIGVPTSKQCIQLIANGFEESSRCSYFLDYDGRLDSDGVTIMRPDGNIKIQRYSDYIPVTAGENIVMELCVPYVENRITWLAYSVYDSNKDVVVGRKVVTTNTISNGYMYSIAKYTVTVDGYMRIMGDTFGDGVFAFYATSNTDEIQMPRQRFKKEVIEASVEKATDIIAQDLVQKADKSTTYTKNEVDQMIDEIPGAEIETDTTLEVAGSPADAKTVGDELRDVKTSLNSIFDSLHADNLFDKTNYSIYNAKIQDNTGYIVTSDASQEMIIVPVEPSTTYIVRKTIGSHMRVGSGGIDEPPHRYTCTSYVDNYQESDLSKPVTITTGDSDHYLYISMWSNSDPVDKRDATIYVDSLCVNKDIALSDFIDSKQCIELLAQGVGESPRCSYFLDYDGRIDSDGTTIMPSTSKIQRYSDYIPVLNGENIIIVLSVPYVEGRTTWLAYSVYDQSKNVVVGRTVITANTISDGYMYSIARYTVTADGYMRIMGDTYGDGIFAFYASSDMNSIQMPRQRFEKEIIEASTEKAIEESGKICVSITAQGIDKASRCSYFLDYDGRLDSDGITVMPSTSKIQRYSEYLPVVAGENIVMKLRVPHVEGRTTWLAYSVYDQSKNVVVERTAVTANTVSDEYMYSIAKYTPSADGYIRIMGDTYGDGIFALYATSDTDEIQIPRQQLKKEIIEASVEKAVNESTSIIRPLVGYVTRYDDVCLGINHRGYNTAPENTIPAYIESYRHGFRYVECDVKLTSDGEFVLLHDATINRTARNADGTAISETTNVTDITYEQALEFDFGIYKSSEYAGTKIPLLSEFLLFCRKVGLHPYLELKFAYTEAATKAVVDMVRAHGMSGKVTYISASGSFLRTINAYEPTARLGIVTELPTSEAVNLAVELKNDSNFVFIDADRATDEAVNICKQINIPMEVWIVTANKNTILSTNPYVTGFTHNYLHAGKVMYEDAMGEA